MTTSSAAGTAPGKNPEETPQGDAMGHENIGRENMHRAGVVYQQLLLNVIHEMRQPLGSIEATAYYLDLVLPRNDRRSREHVSRLHDFVGQCGWILACGLELANDRPLQPVLVSLETTITQVLAARAIPGQPAPVLHLAGELPLVMADPARVRTLVENLLSLFERVATDRHCVMVRTISGNGIVQMEMDVAVPGFQTENALGPGTTLGLDSLRRGAQLHGAELVTAVDPIGGVYARLSWPEVTGPAVQS